MGFNKEQLEVINNNINGAMLVSASAGCGKSHTLIGRIKYMVESGINPSDITITTFTNDSATDLKKKLDKECIFDVNVGTFHSLCRNILIKEGYNIDKRPPANYIFQNRFKALRLDKKILTNDIRSWIDYQKNYGLNSSSPTFMDKDIDYDEYNLRMYFKEYEKIMEEYKCYDYTDWLILAINVLLQDFEEKYTTKYLMIDEFQDSNVLQVKLMQLLCPSKNVVVVGDEKQCLYAFRGSNHGIMENFTKLYPNAKVVRLKTNYRSCKNLVEQGNVFARYYFGDSDLYADAESYNQTDGIIDTMAFENEEAQAIHVVRKVEQWLNEGVEPNDIAILYRNNKNAFEIENELKCKGIDYSISGNNSFFERTESKILLAILRLIQNTKDDSAVEELLMYRVDTLKYIKKPVGTDIIDEADRRNIPLFKVCSSYSKADYNTKRNLDTFVNNIKDLIVLHNDGLDLYSLVKKIIRLFNIVDYVENKYEEQEQIEERLESIDSFTKFIKGNTLDSFLTFVYTDIVQGNKKKKTSKDQIMLRTVHASKGLEWKKVILVSVENDKFPNKKADIYDEACCMYVAVTRAEEEFVLCELGMGNTFTENYFEE